MTPVACKMWCAMSARGTRRRARWTEHIAPILTCSIAQRRERLHTNKYLHGLYRYIMDTNMF